MPSRLMTEVSSLLVVQRLKTNWTAGVPPLLTTKCPRLLAASFRGWPGPTVPFPSVDLCTLCCTPRVSLVEQHLVRDLTKFLRTTFLGFLIESLVVQRT